MTIKETLTSAIVGPDASKHGFFEHSPGVSTVNNRWLAKRQAPSAGSVLPALEPSVGKLKLSASGAPTMAVDEYGQDVVRFDGVDDVLSASGVTGAVSLTVVARVRAATGTDQGIFHTGGGYINRTTTDTTKAFVIGGSSKFPSVNPNQPLYHVFTLVASGTVARYAVDGVAADIASATGTNTEIVLGRASSAIFGNLDILEAFTTPTTLSLADCLNIRQALKNHYGSAMA